MFMYLIVFYQLYNTSKAVGMIRAQERQYILVFFQKRDLYCESRPQILVASVP